MDFVYLVQHTITRSEDDEDTKIIGIFSSKRAAQLAVESLRDKPGFRDPRGEFSIGPCKLDQIYFETGFGPE